MFEIVHEDDDLLVLDKASGVSVLADRTGAPCLWDDLKTRYSHPRLVHRIDKGTSGLLLVALTADCQKSLARTFNQRLIRKHYLAVVAGHIATGTTLSITLPLKRGRKSRFRVAGLREEIRPSRRGWSLPPTEVQDGLDAVTRIRVLAKSDRRTLLAVQPRTGRAHQIRVHLAWIGHAIVGDHLYGAPSSTEQAANRLALHAHRLSIPNVGMFKTQPDTTFSTLLSTDDTQPTPPH